VLVLVLVLLLGWATSMESYVGGLRLSIDVAAIGPGIGWRRHLQAAVCGAGLCFRFVWHYVSTGRAHHVYGQSLTSTRRARCLS